MTKRFAIFQKVIKCVRTASAIEEFLPVVEMSPVITQLERRHLIGGGFSILSIATTHHIYVHLHSNRRARCSTSQLFFATKTHWSVIRCIKFCCSAMLRKIKELNVRGVWKNWNFEGAPTNAYISSKSLRASNWMCVCEHRRYCRP